MFYKAIMKGEYQGQAIMSSLYYRTGFGFDVDGLAIGGAQALGQALKDQVWPAWKQCVPTGFQMTSIDVYPYHDGTFDLAYQNPASVPVLENGSVTDGSDGPAPCAIIKFNLEPTAIINNGPKPPKRGYVAVGPITSTWIDDSGHIGSGFFTDPDGRLNVLANALAANIESLVPPVIWFPVRVSQMKVLGLFKIQSYADVGGAALRRLTSFRRSRMAEM